MKFRTNFQYLVISAGLVLSLGTFVLATHAQSPAPSPAVGTQTETKKDVPYVPTPTAVVEAMLRMANVGSNDVVYDLGSGDGRIPITAVQKYNASRAVGIEIDAKLVEESKANAQAANLGNRVEFRQQDLFETDLSKATVVTLYLLPQVNLRLRPKLLQLPAGTRIVSHAFDMGEWKPDKTETVEGREIFMWTVPKEIPANLR